MSLTRYYKRGTTRVRHFWPLLRSTGRSLRPGLQPVFYLRVNLAESLPLVLKKEYGCHRRDILKTEQCLARQLESSMSASTIIMELNELENSNSFSKRSKIWMILFVAWLCPSIGSTAVDIFFDSLLAIQYYHQYNNNTYVNRSIIRCQECMQEFRSDRK